MTSFGETICLSDLPFLIGQAEYFMSTEGLLILEQKSSELRYPSIATPGRLWPKSRRYLVLLFGYLKMEIKITVLDSWSFVLFCYENYVKG